MVWGQQLPATVRFSQEEEKGAGRFPGCALTSCCGLGWRATVIPWTDDAVVPVPSLFPPHRAHALLWAAQKLLSEGPPGCCGSQVAFKPGNCCPQKPLQLFTPSVCSLPLHFKHIPLSPSLLHTSHWGSHPVHLLSRLAGTPQVLGTRQMGSSAGDCAVGPQLRVVTSCPSWGSTGSGTEWRSTVRSCLVAYCRGTVAFSSSCSWG